MTGRSNDELRAWTADWRAGEPAASEVPSAVRRRMRWGRLRQAAYTGVEVMVATAALVLVTGQALRAPVAWNVIAMAALALLTVAALAFSLWNRIGTWRPAAESTRAFLGLLALRLERRLRGLRAGLYLLALEALVLGPWLWLVLAERAARTGVPVSAAGHAAWFAMLGAWLGVFALGCLWGMRRTRRQLAQLEAVRRGFGDTAEDTP